MTTTTDSTTPVRHLSCIDAVAVVMGIVIGSGIFMSPALIAMNVASEGMMFAAWGLGGLLCLCGALCYAELAGMNPRAGGEYVYLTQSLGRPVGFFFAWARITVIQTGSIAATAYIFGSYATAILPLGPRSPLIYAVSATAVLTALNAAGLRTEKWTQNLLTAAKVVGVAAIAVVGFTVAQPEASPAPADTSGAGSGAFGLAMVFVLYAFGGWNEAAYVAGEVRDARRNMLRVLLISIIALTGLYLAVNFAYLRILGLAGMGDAKAVAADAMTRVLGGAGGTAVSVLVAVSALGAIHGCIFTGARAVSALGDDFPVFRSLSRWNGRFKTPLNAIVLQGAVALVLIVLPGLGKGFEKVLGSGFKAAVEYTAPVFWLFFLLTGVSVFVFRMKAPNCERPFRVPLYPLTVAVFVVMCGYMLYSSIAYTKMGALAGVAVLAAGLPVYLIFRRSAK